MVGNEFQIRVQADDGIHLVETTGAHGATETSIDAPEGSVLVVAEPLQWAEHAQVTVDGARLEALPDKASPTYQLPAGTGELVITLPSEQRWWHVGQVLGLLALVFLAIPFGRRAARVGER